LTLAWTQAQIQLHHLGISIEEAHLFQRLANAVLFADGSQRPSSDLLSRSTLDRNVLWASGISGDLPIVVVRINEVDDVEIVRQLLRAHEYWRMKQLFADLVIINEKPSSYAQDLQGSLDNLVHGSRLRLAPNSEHMRGSIFSAPRRPHRAAGKSPSPKCRPRSPAQLARHSCGTNDAHAAT